MGVMGDENKMKDKAVFSKQESSLLETLSVQKAQLIEMTSSESQ